MKLTPNVFLIGSGEYGLSHEFDCSVYLIIDNDTREAVIIDAGAGREPEHILRNIIEDGIDPHLVKAIFLTHEHADHVGGAPWLREKIGCKVYAPVGADELIERGTDDELGLSIAKRSGVYAPDYHYPHFKVDGTIADGDSFTIGKLQLQAISLPGHSRHSMCYLLKGEKQRALFTGDVVFFGGEIGLLNCPGSSLADYRANIHKLANLNIEGLFPGHKVFVLKGGQQHLDRAISALGRLAVPPTFFQETCY